MWPLFPSEETSSRTHKCVRCTKLTDPSLLHCDACGHRFTEADKLDMNACFEERRRTLPSSLVFPIALVALVILAMIYA